MYKSYKLLPWIYFKIESANFIFIFDFTGNTSDLQEAISEGASSHSVGSVDLENDDFSDMISANVSGQGTPNISGRDTPPSRAGSVEAPVHQLQQENIQPIQLPVTVPKSNGEDVTDRFGKFEIKKEFVPGK